MTAGDLGNDVDDHLAWHRVDRRFADGQRQPWQGDGTDALSGPESHAAT